MISITMSDHNLIIGILVKYALHEPLTDKEQEAFAAWQAESEGNKTIADRFGDPEWVADHRRELHQAPTDELWAAVQRNIGSDAPAEPVLPAEQTPRRRISRY